MFYQKVNFTSFHKAFFDHGRENQFSYTGLLMLYDYLGDLSDSIGEDLELDVISLCCQYTEYTKEEFLNDYSLDGIDGIDSLEQALMDGDLDCVIAYDIDNDVILADNDR